MGAAVAVLLEIGWRPSQPGLWLTPDGSQMAAYTGQAWEPAAIVDAITKAFVAKQWVEASHHFQGQGLETGPA